MATIDSAILAAQTGGQQTPNTPPALDPASAVNVPEISEGQARFLKEQRERQRDLDKKQAAIEKAQADLLGEEEAQKLREQEAAEANKAATVRAAETTIKQAQQIVRRADVSIGRLPTPGSIVVPLILLLLLFFVLIQINGNSRLAWLWLALTGNARIAGSSSTAATATATSPGSTGPVAVAPPPITLAATLSPLAAHTVWTGNGMVGGLY
jgi:hypothetical protein